MAVHPRARSQGVGGALLRFADGEARRRGRRTLSLYCISANTRAHALYERHGYRDVRREDLWWCAWALGFRFTDQMRKGLPGRLIAPSGEPAGACTRLQRRSTA